MMNPTFDHMPISTMPHAAVPAERDIRRTAGGHQPRSSAVGVEIVRSLALMLMAAGLAALALMTQKLILPWVGDDLFLNWAALWCVLLSALLLLSRLVTVLAQRVLVTLDTWVWQLARHRAARRQSAALGPQS